MTPPADLLCLDTARRLGGGQVSIERILLRLDRGRIRPALACPRGSVLASRISGAGIAVLPWLPPSRTVRAGRRDLLASGITRAITLPPAAAFSVARLASWARGRRQLVLHANTFQGGILGAWLAAVTGRPLVFHDRVLADHGAIGRWLSARADLILAVTQAVAEKWGARYSAKTRVLLDGCDVDRLRPGRRDSARASLGLSADDTVLLTISRISREKSLEILLEAASLLPRAPVVLVAGEPFLPEDHAYAAELKTLASRRGVRARFLGFVADASAVLDAADLFVFTSPVDSFGLAVLEAMAMEKAVVAPRAAGPLGIIEAGRTGLFFAAGDAADLAARISELVDDEGLRRILGAAARRVVVDRYPLRRTVEDFEEVIRSLAGPQPPGPERPS
jgi:glycosyltransferase involved in cell wall biosynthesis